MAEIERIDDASPPFRELHGDYVANAGQVLNLREYLDYFEPLGSALSRLPDGVGGPFVHHFTDGGGRTIGSFGWVVSAASKRFGGWKLWGMWSDRAIPAVALPLYWPALSDPAQASELVRRANADAGRLFRRDRWPGLLDDLKMTRLHDRAFRETLKAELSRAYAVPPPHRQPIEVELTPHTLDLLPWLYVLGPVDPAAAQLQPSRFNGPGYQYILSEQQIAARDDTVITEDVDAIVDTAADDVRQAWRMATDLRARRERPKHAAPKRRVVTPPDDQSWENEMRSGSSTQRQPRKRASEPEDIDVGRSFKEAGAMLAGIWTPVYQIAVLGLLAWIAYNVNIIRIAVVAERPTPPVVESVREPERTATVAEVETARSRTRRIAAALAAQPPAGIRVDATVLEDISRGGAESSGVLARVAVEVFVRRNACYRGTDVVDGRFSTAERRAMRACAVLQDERLMKSADEPDVTRSLQWLDRATSAP